MKIYLDNNLGVATVEQEELTQDTYGYNILKVYIPNAVLTPYDSFTCYYGALLQNGRKVGWFAMEAKTSSDADYEENYTLYKATLEQCVVSVEGKVYIGCQVLLGNSGNATLIKKNTAVVQFNVRKSVAINNDILVLDPDQTNTDVLESYKNLLENALVTYATKTELSLKADKSTTYTKTEADALLDAKADKTDVFERYDNVDITSTLTLTNHYLDKANGNANPDGNSKCTDYIDLSSYTGFYVSGHSQYATTLICTYDENKTFLRSYGDGTSAGQTFTDYEYIPQSDEKYVRFSTYQYTQYPLTIIALGEIVNIAKTKENNYLYKKKYVACGDSFTKGDVISSDKVYPYLIAQRNDMTLVNMSANGSYCHYGENGFTNPNNSYYYQNIPLDADYITIAYGLNETSTTIGTKDSNDNTTIWGAYNEVLGWITTNIPNAKVGIISNDAWMTYDLRNALREIASYWGVEFLDLKEYGKAFMISGKYSQDGNTNPSVVSQRTTQYCVSSQNGHPNELGHKVRSYIVENFLRGACGVDNSYTRKEVDAKLQTKQNVLTFDDVPTQNSNNPVKSGGVYSAIKDNKDYTDNAINDLRWELGSHTLDVTTDTDVAYSKSVPSGAIGCQINTLGGMSYKTTNLIVLNDETITASGLTFTISGGKITSSGTPSGGGWIRIKSIDLNVGTYSYNDFTSANSRVYLINNSYVQLTTPFTVTEASTFYIAVQGNSITNNGQLDNSSLMLVSGSTAPTTWSEGFSGIRDSAVTSVVSKDSNDTTVATFPIPSEIQALDGYGWGVNSTCYNYIDYDRKVFVKKVGRYTFTGNETFIKANNSYGTAALDSVIKPLDSNANIINALLVGFTTDNANNVYAGVTDNTISGIVAANANKFRIHSSAFESVTDVQTALAGKTLYYELATPIETDISAYLTTDTIDVEPNGTLEFTNTYSQDVPSDIDYLIEEVKA